MFLRRNARSSTPILVSLVVSSCPDEAWIIKFRVYSLLFYVPLMLDFEWLEFSLKSGCEISRYVVGNLKLLFLFVQVELRLFCIRVKLRILFDIIRSHVIWILVLDHLVLSFDTFRARYAFVILTFEILIQISFNKL